MSHYYVDDFDAMPSDDGSPQAAAIDPATLPQTEIACTADGSSTFLLDLYCLGVKNAMFGIAERDQYDKLIINKIQNTYDVQSFEPSCARKLVEGSVEYARKLGFSPHADYAKAKAIFGDIDVATCERSFEGN